MVQEGDGSLSLCVSQSLRHGGQAWQGGLSAKGCLFPSPMLSPGGGHSAGTVGSSCWQCGFDEG